MDAKNVNTSEQKKIIQDSANGLVAYIHIHILYMARGLTPCVDKVYSPSGCM